MNSVKFLVFADLHHYPGIFLTDARKRLADIMQRADQVKADCIISLGDFCHCPPKFPEIIEDSKKTKIPFMHILGNHDTDNAPVKNVIKLYDMPDEYYFFDMNNFRFIMLNSNYYVDSGKYIPFEYGNYFKFPKTRESIPPEQLLWLEKSIKDSPYPCLLFSHGSIERESDGGICNRDEVLKIIRAVNKKERKVLMAFNGHHHRNALHIIENVAFFDVNSASYDWIDNPHYLFPEELQKEFRSIIHQIIYTEALSAVVTISDNGIIEIEGGKCDFLYGITREMTDNKPYDNAGRRCRAEILSAKFALM